jgi:hypothetical protein
MFGISLSFLADILSRILSCILLDIRTFGFLSGM